MSLLNGSEVYSLCRLIMSSCINNILLNGERLKYDGVPLSQVSQAIILFEL